MRNNLPLKVLFPIYEPYMFLNKDNTIGGPYKQLLEKLIFHVVKNFNVTFVPFHHKESLACSLSDCGYILRSFQNGLIDYYPWNSILPEIYANISLGTIKSVTSCKIWTRSYKKLTTEYVRVMVSSQTMERSTFFLINLCVFLPMCLIALFNGNSFVKTFFYILGSVYDKSACMYKQLIELTKSRIAVASTVWFVLFVQIIMLSNLRTGLMSEQDHGKVMNFDDLIKHNFSAHKVSFSNCLPIIKTIATHQDDGQLNDFEMSIINGKGTISVAIVDDREEKEIVEYLCINPKNLQTDNFYLSPVIAERIVNTISSSFTAKPVFKALNRAIYFNYESGAFRMAENFLAQIIRIIFGETSQQSCHGTFYHIESESTHPLHIHFFRRTFIGYLLLTFISILIFIVEIIVARM